MTPKNIGDATANNKQFYSKYMESQSVRTNAQNISNLLNTGLSPECLDICVQLCEAGVAPRVLARIVTQIRSQMANINNDEQR